MRADRFDDITRWLAAEAPVGTRRSFLRALGLGGAATAVAPGLLGAAPLPAAEPSPATAQDTPMDEIEELAFDLALDVELIFRFVRDEVVYDPYAGVLRGAKATLWGLAGNAADQAVLLAALLEAALVPTRFVVGELTDEAAPALLAAGVLDEARAQARTERLLTPPVEPEADAEPLTPEQEAFVERFAALAEDVLARVDGHVAAGIATVTEGLAGAGIALPTVEVALPEEERRRHIWVQYANGTEWVDLDPSIPTAEPGDVFATGGASLDELPPELFHRVAIRLVAEQVMGDQVTRNELLAFERPSHELMGVPISLVHPQPDALSSIGVAIGGLIDGYRNFVPTLMVGEETVVGTPVTFGTGGGLLDTFDPTAIEGDTVAEWLEVTVTTPDGAQTTTRTVFDRADPERRAAGTVDPTAIAPVDFVDAGDAESSFMPLAGLWAMAVVAGPVPRRLTARSLPENVTVDDLLPALLAYHHAQQVEMSRLPDLAGVRVYHDRANVTAFSLRPTEVEGDGGSATIGIDLLHRSVAAAPGADATAVHPLVAAGVVAHAVEQGMFEAGGMEPLSLPVTATRGVLPIFAEAATQGIATVVLTPDGGGAAIPEMGAAPRALVEAALAAGLLVIVPERPVAVGGVERLGWWLVDPATGATWDQMEDGSGSTATESAFLWVKIAICAGVFAALGVLLGLMFAQVDDGVSVGGAVARGVLGATGAAGAVVACG